MNTYSSLLSSEPLTLDRIVMDEFLYHGREHVHELLEVMRAVDGCRMGDEEIHAFFLNHIVGRSNFWSSFSTRTLGGWKRIVAFVGYLRKRSG